MLQRHNMSAVARPASPSWVFGFLAAVFGLQLGLLMFGGTSLRLPLRIGAFAASLGLAALFRRRHATHPSLRWMGWAVAVLLIGFLQTPGDLWVAGAAQVLLYGAVLAPVAWVGATRFTVRHFRVAILMLWAFNTASAFVGVLQVYYPDRFDGAVSANIKDEKHYLQAMTITLASGERRLRPSGLTDLPGGAAIAGANAIVLGMGILLTTRRPLLWTLSVGGMAIGLFSIYLSHTRTNLVMAGVMVAAMILILGRRGDWSATTKIIAVVAGVAVVATSWAFAVGGDQTIKRFGSLIESDPQTVLYETRGKFLHDTLAVLLFKYPVGAGLGRWGMMNMYFGRMDRMLYSEMTWTSLLYDGGLPLMVIYGIALFVALRLAWTIGTSRSMGELSNWGALVFAHTLGGIAVSFSYPIFSQQPGMEIWLLNACLFVACKMRIVEQRRAQVVETARYDFNSRLPALQT